MPAIGSAQQVGVNSSSLQGYTGALNVPSAYTLQTGEAVLQYANSFITSDRYEHNHDAIVNFGLLPNLEVGARIAWDTTHTNCYLQNCGVRDLSANAKLALPLIPDNWFKLAVGAQDLGGEVKYFSSKYVVASKQFQYGRIDVGYGKTVQPNRYLSGNFIAVEVQPVNWFSLISEYDAKDFNAGVRVGLPTAWRPKGIRPEVKFMAYSNRNTNRDELFLSLSVSISMGDSKANSTSRLVADSQVEAATAPQQMSKSGASEQGNAKPRDPEASLTLPPNEKSGAFYRALGEQLISDKFESVMVGECNNELYVAFENNQFNRNELDALALALARVANYAQGIYVDAHVILRNLRVPVLDVVVRIHKNDDIKLVRGAKPFSVVATRYPDNDLLKGVNWIFNGSYGLLVKPRIALSPNLVTAVATEYGVFDYSLALQTDLSVSPWRGALLSATYNLPLDQTRNFDSYVPDYGLKGVFFEQRQRKLWSEYELQQTLKFGSNLYTAFHAGHYMNDYSGAYNQTVWLSPKGQHKIGLRVGEFIKENGPLVKYDSELLSYRYFLSDRDVSIEATFGRFFEGDKGFRVDSRFWFGESAITLTYKKTDAQFVGLGWSIPLTPRRDLNTRYAVISGREDWSYGLQTRIREPSNYTGFGTALIPGGRNDIERAFLNRDRLSPDYVNEHLNHLQESPEQQ